MKSSVEEKRVAIEAIATLVYRKRDLFEFILKPAGVPEEIYLSLAIRRDELTGKPLSKRQMAPLILEALNDSANGPLILRTIIEIAANWDKYYLAHEEYDARATVQKARDVLGTLETMENLERADYEREKNQDLQSQKQEDANYLRKGSGDLLVGFDQLVLDDDAQRRGYLLEGLLTQLFQLHSIPIYESFRRNSGAEQIDGAFFLDGWYYLIECRWRSKPADVQQLDGLSGKLSRSSAQTLGLFLSINSWSDKVVPMLKQNQNKRIILMDGYDLRIVLDRAIDLRAFLLAKGAALGIRSEPFLSIRDHLRTVEV